MVTRPGSSLERVMVDLCARSLRVACKVGLLMHVLCLDICLLLIPPPPPPLRGPPGLVCMFCPWNALMMQTCFR